MRATLLLSLLLSACGYHLVDTGRTVHVALSVEGAPHPEAVPAVSEALAVRLRDEGLRLSPDAADAELDVVLTGSHEVAALPAQAPDNSFAPAAWDVALAARATLRRAGGTAIELGVFDAAGLEPSAAEVVADDSAQSSAYALAARLLAERIVAALLAAW